MSRAPSRWMVWAAGLLAGLAVYLLAGCGDTPPPPAAGAAPTVADPRAVVLFLGDSLTAGYGLSSDEAFPALIQQRIDDAGLAYRVVNAGVSGDTSAGGVRRIDWLLKLPVAVLVVELGANDMLRGQDPDNLHRNLAQIIDRTRAAHPDARFVIAGMRAVPNLGAAYAKPFEAVFPELARGAGAALIPFLLDGVAGDPSLNLPDGIHPTAAGHRIIADTVWDVLAPELR